MLLLFWVALQSPAQVRDVIDDIRCQESVYNSVSYVLVDEVVAPVDLHGGRSVKSSSERYEYRTDGTRFEIVFTDVNRSYSGKVTRYSSHVVFNGEELTALSGDEFVHSDEPLPDHFVPSPHVLLLPPHLRDMKLADWLGGVRDPDGGSGRVGTLRLLPDSEVDGLTTHVLEVPLRSDLSGEVFAVYTLFLAPDRNMIPVRAELRTSPGETPWAISRVDSFTEAQPGTYFPAKIAADQWQKGSGGDPEKHSHHIVRTTEDIELQPNCQVGDFSLFEPLAGQIVYRYRGGSIEVRPEPDNTEERQP